MKLILTLSIIVVIVVQMFAQIDTTRKEFFPLHVGDTWQYSTEDGMLLTAKIRADTLIDNITYYIFEKIGGIRTLGSGIIRVDSLAKVQTRWGGPIGGDSCGGNNIYERSTYHLNEPDSTLWEICEDFNGFLGIPLIRFNYLTSKNLFNKHTEVMFFDFGGYLLGEDTAWGYGAMLARGIGVVEERYFEGGYRILQGAVINGKKYGTIVSVNEPAEIIPKEIILYQNFPNPFNPTTKIRYEITKTIHIKLSIINILGQKITTLLNEEKQPGNYVVEFNASNLSSGVYIAVLETMEARKTKAMLLIK